MPDQIEVRLLGADVDDDELDVLTRNLRAELLELDIDDVRPQTGGPAPEGTKAGVLEVLGSLLISAGPELLPVIFDLLASWRKRQTVPLEIEIRHHKLKTLVTPAQRDEAFAMWRHAVEADDKQRPETD